MTAAAAGAGLRALTAHDIVMHVLAELAKRGALPTFGPATLPKADEAAARLLWALGVEDPTDPLADVVGLAEHAAYRAHLARLARLRGGRDA